MPSLIPSFRRAIHLVAPYSWSCSECLAVFNMAPPHCSSPTLGQVNQINLQFEAHCQHVHPRLFPVVGLTLPD